jgi:molecular chaperone IbpA
MNTIDELIRQTNKNVIGFEPVFSLLREKIPSLETGGSYPPYNIEKLEDENKYRVTLAVAGFNSEDLEVIQEKNKLKITGSINKENETNKTFLYKGIGNRDFVRIFTVDEKVEVQNITLINGLLTIDLLKVIPEEQLPKILKIN